MQKKERVPVAKKVESLSKISQKLETEPWFFDIIFSYSKERYSMFDLKYYNM